MHSEDHFKLLALRLTDQVSHLTEIVSKMQSSIKRLEQDKACSKNGNSFAFTSSSSACPQEELLPSEQLLLFQPSPIKLFSSSPVPEDDLVMSYFCNSPMEKPVPVLNAIFKSDVSPMMGYYDTSMMGDCVPGDAEFIPHGPAGKQISAVASSQNHRKPTRKASGPLRILIVEDDPLCQALISHIIKSLNIGYCEVVADGVEAVINMSTNSFDLILMDMQLPHLDGLQATQNIRKFNRRTPIVSMTARLGEDDIRRYFEGGIDEVLPKPFDKQSVRRIIGQFYKLSINEDENVDEHEHSAG